jgi:hypothetical protein
MWVRSLSAAACGVLALSAAGTAHGSDYRHAAVVSEDAADWTPDLVPVSGSAKPVAYSVAEAGDQMVVGGRFGMVDDNSGRATIQLARQNVVAFDATDGTVNTGFAPQVDGQVWSVLSDGTSVYIGGNFKTVNGTPQPALAKLNLATGALDPTFRSPYRGGRVTDMEMHNGRLVVAGTITRKIVALNATTGAPTTYVRQVVGNRLPNSDALQVFKFDISTDGKHLVAVGNFLTVDGADRPRAFMLDLDATRSTLSDWNYEPLGIPCTSGRTNAQAYVQDVEFAPDSSWFSFAAFGYMYQSGQRGFQLCDSVSRFETATLNPAAPTWINYTGGDSLKSVGVTDKAVYVQGHSRWLDNPFGQDSKGPGAVDRLGGGAVDPVTGLALAWNPVMPQQSGGYQILPTAAGVWFATDGARFGGEYHRGIRFAPLP